LELAPGLSEALKSNPHLAPVLVSRADGNPVSVHDVWNTLDKDEVFAGFEPDKQHEVTVTFGIDGHGDPPPYQIGMADGLVDLVGLEVGGLLSYTERQLPLSRF
jgi:hypothetical protein